MNFLRGAKICLIPVHSPRSKKSTDKMYLCGKIATMVDIFIDIATLHYIL